MMCRASVRGRVTVVLLAALMLGCPAAEEPGEGEPGADDLQSVEEAEELLAELAREDRQRFRDQSFEEFMATVFREPEGGKFIVNGDTPILNEKRLREFFEQQVQTEPEPSAQELLVHTTGGLDATWNDAMQRDLTYCVSDAFGDRHDDVVGEMEAATLAWETAAAVDFIHLAEHDGDCTSANAAVVFDVRPVDVDGRYLARAFFPDEPRPARNVLIDESSFDLGPGNLQLDGILRHELGHTLGFRHEHTRPSVGRCFEDTSWRPVTDYDPLSVMHYPQCNGLGDWTLTLTDLDRNGAACVYGAAEGFTIDTELCIPEREPDVEEGEPVTETFTDQSVEQDEEKQYGPFPVAGGRLFEARIRGGAGDPDLYVRFDAEPLQAAWDCRPWLFGPDEECLVDAPVDAQLAFVMVHGWDDGDYELEVVHRPPAQ